MLIRARPKRTQTPAKRPYRYRWFFRILNPDTSERAQKKPSVSGGLSKEADVRAYFFALRLNFVVNFSTRPAVSTRRFSPV
jgi:hypothetical protein